MLLAVCRLLAVALWSVSFALMLLGLIGDRGALYAFSCWLALVACVPTSHVVVEHAMGHALRSQREELAEAVGIVIGEEMNGHPVRPIR